MANVMAFSAHAAKVSDDILAAFRFEVTVMNVDRLIYVRGFPKFFVKNAPFARRYIFSADVKELGVDDFIFLHKAPCHFLIIAHASSELLAS